MPHVSKMNGNSLTGSLLKPLLLILSLMMALISTVAISADLPSASPQSQGLSKERLSRIRSVIETEINANRMPGAVVLIARKGAIVHADSIGWQD